MRAAAAGKSNIGIPKSVGREYVRADRAKARKSSGSKVRAKRRK